MVHDVFNRRIGMKKGAGKLKFVTETLAGKVDLFCVRAPPEHKD